MCGWGRARWMAVDTNNCEHVFSICVQITDKYQKYRKGYFLLPSSREACLPAVCKEDICQHGTTYSGTWGRHTRAPETLLEPTTNCCRKHSILRFDSRRSPRIPTNNRQLPWRRGWRPDSCRLRCGSTDINLLSVCLKKSSLCFRLKNEILIFLNELLQSILILYWKSTTFASFIIDGN